MPTFFDKFRRYAKDYVRERSTKTAGAYGNAVPGTPDELDVKGILTNKSSMGSVVAEGGSVVPIWRKEKVFYCGPEIDVEGGDHIVDWDTRYLVRSVDWQDDFKNKRSHKVAHLDIVT